jgi:hypothetical protein
MELIQGYDADGQPLIIPALAITGALQDISGRDAEAMLRGLEMLGNTMTAALRDAEQAAHLAAVISRTGLSPWDAQPARSNGQRGSRMAVQIFSAVSGMSRCRTPYGLSAFITALTSAGVTPIVPLSPIPLTPSGLAGDGVHTR